MVCEADEFQGKGARQGWEGVTFVDNVGKSGAILLRQILISIVWPLILDISLNMLTRFASGPLA